MLNPQAGTDTNWVFGLNLNHSQSPSTFCPYIIVPYPLTIHNPLATSLLPSTKAPCVSACAERQTGRPLWPRGAPPRGIRGRVPAQEVPAAAGRRRRRVRVRLAKGAPYNLAARAAAVLRPRHLPCTRAWLLAALCAMCALLSIQHS